MSQALAMAAPAAFGSASGASAVVVHAQHAFEAEGGGQRRREQAVLAARAATAAPLFQRRHQRGVEAVAGMAFGRRQAQPLHQPRHRFAPGQEHGGQAAPLRRCRGGRPGGQRALDLGGGGRHVQAGGGARRRRIPAAIRVDRFAVARRVAAHQVALRAGQVLDGDDARPPGQQALVQQAQGGRLERRRQVLQVGGAQHQHLVRHALCRTLQCGRVEACGAVGRMRVGAGDVQQGSCQQAGKSVVHSVVPSGVVDHETDPAPLRARAAQE
ncbi:hypothetical protein [Massilia forsythiae]|uniref:hypothetical protein n=1 Tax=Massilia forsythiae TaxID=2728020 RepID=UPI001E28434B|nr:hypothetical protein [Massilia forsythiae]